MSLWFQSGLSFSNSFEACPHQLERFRNCFPFALMPAPRYLHADLIGIPIPSRKAIVAYKATENFMCFPFEVAIPFCRALPRPRRVEAFF